MAPSHVSGTLELPHSRKTTVLISKARIMFAKNADVVSIAQQLPMGHIAKAKLAQKVQNPCASLKLLTSVSNSSAEAE
jgi:hypothetical protein